MAVRLPKREEDRLREIAAAGRAGSPASICEASTERLAGRQFVNVAVGRAYVSKVGEEWLEAVERGQQVPHPGLLPLKQAFLRVCYEDPENEAGVRISIGEFRAFLAQFEVQRLSEVPPEYHPLAWRWIRQRAIDFGVTLPEHV